MWIVIEILLQKKPIQQIPLSLPVYEQIQNSTKRF